jgi:type III secretion system YscQ/HrcQ family protein
VSSGQPKSGPKSASRSGQSSGSGSGSGWGSGSSSRAVTDGPLGDLPNLTRRQARLTMRLARAGRRLGGLRDWLGEVLGVPPRLDQAEVLWRASGLKRPGTIAQFSWPRLGTRIGLGIEPVIAHAIVDRLLGFDRLDAEGRLQVTPVEWGILSYVIAQGLERLDASAGPLGPWDLTIDRVGPEPFSTEGLGGVATLVWPIRVGTWSGSVRLWVPELVISLILADDPCSAVSIEPADLLGRFANLTEEWRAEAGTSTLGRGLSRLRKGSVLPIDGSTLTGTVQSPAGAMRLILRERSHRTWIAAEAVAGSGGARLQVLSLPCREIIPEETSAMTESKGQGQSADVAGGLPPAEVPVTLVIELGRLNIPLSRLAELRPGDVLELSRHAREPVELTCGNKLVARGELVQIDTELGVRVLSVFL